MGKLILVTGGARSGKSTYAEKLAACIAKKVLYIATAIPFDEEMKNRIAKHQLSRPQSWDTYEGYRDVAEVIAEKGNTYPVMLLDCVTVMLTNLLWEFPGIDFEQPSEEILGQAEHFIKNEFEKLLTAAAKYEGTFIMVTNELGSGLVPEAPIARGFRDIAGRVNQQLAAACQQVYLTVCGIPIQIKHEEQHE